jgi:hypothetical protein
MTLSACGGADELTPFLVSDPPSIFMGVDGPPVVIQLQNLRSFPVRVTHIESAEDSLLLVHEPLPWNLAANSEAPISVSFQPWAFPGNESLTIRGPQGSLEIDVTAITCDRDNDSYPSPQCGGDDCDDQSDLIHPGAPELCNGLDDDCDGERDNGLATSTLYADDDFDRFGDPNNTVEVCGELDGYVSNFGDCDDNDRRVNPDADEYCTGRDENCDGLIDYRAVDRRILKVDADGDGFGNPDIFTRVCPGTPGYTTDGSDCNDQDADIFPNADELCDGQDNDCDGETDNNATDSINGYVDQDRDGFGDDSAPILACALADGIAIVSGDCDDTDDRRSPGVPETCDGLDNDCDLDVDEDAEDCLPDCSAPIAGLANTIAGLRTTTPNILDTSGPSIVGDGDFARALAVGDINSDGCDDVLVSATSQQPGDDRGVVYVFHGPIVTALRTEDANATYFGDDPSFGETLAVLPSTDATSRVAIGASADVDSAVFVFDAAPGVFGSQDATLRISQSANPLALSTLIGSGDIDDDGLSDLLISEQAQDQATLWGVPGDAVGMLDVANSPIFTAHSDTPDIGAAVIGDTNDDGFTDVVVRASADASTRLAVFPGPVVGSLDLSEAPVTSGAGPLLAAAGDLDADGLDDFLYQYSYNTTEGVRFGYSLIPSSNVQPWSIRAGALTSDAVSIAVASDLDADGYGDFTTSRSLGACEQQDGGTVSIGYGAKPSTTYILGLAGRTVSGTSLGDRLGDILATGDLNGDGIEDIVATMPGFDTETGMDDGGAFVLYGLPRRDEQFPNALPTIEECETDAAEDLGDVTVGYQFCLRTSEPILSTGLEWTYDITATVLVAGDVADDAESPHPGTRQHGQCTLPIVVATLIGDDGVTYEMRTDTQPTADTALAVGQRVRFGLAGHAVSTSSRTVYWQNQAIADASGLVVGFHIGAPNWCKNPLSYHLWDMQDVCDETVVSSVTWRQRVNGVLLQSNATSRINTMGGPMLFREYGNQDLLGISSPPQRYKEFSFARDQTEPAPTSR